MLAGARAHDHYRLRTRRALRPKACSALAIGLLAACSAASTTAPGAAQPAASAPITARQTFARNAVYFVVTDRFVNGDTGTTTGDQGGKYRTLRHPAAALRRRGRQHRLPRRLQGLVDHLDYIREMGFSAVWITPVVDNPDEHFTGGSQPGCGTILSDRGKAGYHGYRGVDFYRVDEHLPSPGLDFKGWLMPCTREGHEAGARHRGQPRLAGLDHGLTTSPSSARSTAGRHAARRPPEPAARQAEPGAEPAAPLYNTTGPVDGAKGSIYDGNLAQLGDFFDAATRGAGLSCGRFTNTGSSKGADAFPHRHHRVDADPFWQSFTQRIRASHPGFWHVRRGLRPRRRQIAATRCPARARPRCLTSR